MGQRDFILKLAIDSFNSQYNYKFTPEEFEIFSIPPNPTSRIAFELHTIIPGDFLRLRLYFGFDIDTRLGSYVLNDQANMDRGLGEKLFVAEGWLDDSFYYLDKDISKASTSVSATPSSPSSSINLNNSSPLTVSYVSIPDAIATVGGGQLLFQNQT